MAALKELRRLKDEERTLMNIASKLSDQLNRLKVEELALLNMMKTQQKDVEIEIINDEAMETDRIPDKTRQEDNEDSKTEEEDKLVPLDLSVAKDKSVMDDLVEEEEEEEDDDGDKDELTKYII